MSYADQYVTSVFQYTFSYNV